MSPKRKAGQRQRIWIGLLRRAARRDAAVRAAQETATEEIADIQNYALTVWLAEEAMALALRMAHGEF